MRIIPAIDIIDGQCVRLEQGDYSRKKRYDTNPVTLAKRWENEGIRYLHLVDLDGAKAGKPVNLRILEEIATQTTLAIDFGGGIKDTEALEQAFNAGAKQITAGSVAVKNPEMVGAWLKRFGAEKIILGADVKEKKVYINGWKTETQWELFAFLDNYLQKGARYVVCTDIARDGLLQGSAVALYRDILIRFPQIKLIASGGVHDVEDLDQLARAGLEGAIIGKALLEGKITMKELKKYAV